MKPLMKLLFVPFALAILLAFTSLPAFSACTTTPFTYQGSGYLTALLVNPTTTVSGPIDANGCDIGVYFDNGKGSVDKATITNANYFGVLVNGDVNNVSVDVTNSSISKIGWTAIYYRSFSLTGSASGTISGNTISSYKKIGIMANGPGASAIITGNTVTGDGPIDTIGQNGIQIGYGAGASVMRNTVTENSYTGGIWSASGILVLGGPYFGTGPDGLPYAYTVGTRVVGNTATGNDIGVATVNYDASGGEPTTATNNKVINNTLTNDYCKNTNFQAGVDDSGMNDKIINNAISGAGYDPTTCSVAFSIDNEWTDTNTKIHANTIEGSLAKP
jgi:parallel beta-helix repeat protein